MTTPGAPATTPDYPLATRTKLYGILRCVDCANTDADKRLVWTSMMEDWIAELDGVIAPAGDLSLPKTIPGVRTHRGGWSGAKKRRGGTEFGSGKGQGSGGAA